MRCKELLADLTALVDGALSPGEKAAVEAHLSGCDRCRVEVEQLRRTAALQRIALSQLPELSPGFETRLKQTLLEAADEPSAWLGWLRPSHWTALWKPATVVAVTAALILLAAAPLGGPSAVLVPLGIQAPPPELAQEPELFQDYPIFEHLDELEHFETVNAMPLDEDVMGKRKGAG